MWFLIVLFYKVISSLQAKHSS